jgi:hypothetical protein
MRGSPLLNALIAFLAIALLGIPVQRLTRAVAIAAPTPAPVAADAEQKVPVELRFTTPPKSVRIQHLGKVIWSADEPGTSADAELTLAWPKEGIDLLVEIDWPDDAPLSAARVVLTDPDNNERTETIWGTGRKNKVLTFQ